MKYTTAILTLAAAVSAQDISVFPECSLPCIITAVGTTSCEATDFACVCKNMDAIKTAATPCVVDKCGIDVALNQVLPATEKFCADVDTNPPASSSSGGNSNATTSVAQPTTDIPPPTTTEEPPATTTDDGGDEEDESTSAPGSFVTSAPSVPPSSIGGGGDATSSSSTAKATSSVQTAGAAVVGAVGGWGMALLGLVAAL